MLRTSLILVFILSLSLPLFSCKESDERLKSEIQQRDHRIANLEQKIAALQQSEVEVPDPQRQDINNTETHASGQQQNKAPENEALSEMQSQMRALVDQIDDQQKIINQLTIALQKDKTPVVHHKPKDDSSSEIQPKVTENKQDTEKPNNESTTSPTEGDPEKKHVADHQQDQQDSTDNTTPMPKSIHDTHEDKQPVNTAHANNSAKPIGFQLASSTEVYQREQHAEDYYKVLLAQNIPGYMDRTWQMSLEICFNRREWLFKKTKENRYFIIFRGVADQVFADHIPEISTGHEVTIIWECDPKDKSITLDHVQFERAKLHGSLKPFYRIIAEAR